VGADGGGGQWPPPFPPSVELHNTRFVLQATSLRICFGASTFSFMQRARDALLLPLLLLLSCVVARDADSLLQMQQWTLLHPQLLLPLPLLRPQGLLLTMPE
jgi:hypothetical protein